MGIFSRKDRQPPPDSAGYEIADVYRTLREQVLGLVREPAPFPADGPVAVLMETGYPGAVVSLAAVADGSTSLYLSNGGGGVGAREHESVRAASSRLLAGVAAAADRLQPTDHCPLPAVGQVRFDRVRAAGSAAAE